jgi:hypothetical protein
MEGMAGMLAVPEDGVREMNMKEWSEALGMRGEGRECPRDEKNADYRYWAGYKLGLCLHADLVAGRDIPGEANTRGWREVMMARKPQRRMRSSFPGDGNYTYLAFRSMKFVRREA